MWLHASICSCPDPPPAPPSSFPSTLYATTCTTAYTLPPVATLASAASTNPSSTLFSVLSFSSLSPYSHGLFRGFLIGASFIIVMEACALFFVCFLLFDPTRKLVAHLSPVAAGPSSSSSPQQPKKISATRAVRKQASVLPFRRPKTVADFYDHSINEHELPWPSNIVDFLKTALIPTPEDSPYDALKIDASPSSSATPEAATAKAAKPPAVMGVQILAASPPDEAKWLNVLVHRFFLALRDSPLFKMRMMAKMAERTNVKLRTNSFVSHITILDVSLGEHVPEVLGVRMVKSRSEDLAVVLELDVAYKGGCTVAIETTLTAGAKFPVQVHTSGFAGKMLLRAPSVDWSDMVSVAFVEDPGISFLVDSPLTVRENELFRRAVNKVLASVLRRAVLEMWVLPNWRNIFMPMMTPTPEEELARATSGQMQKHQQVKKALAKNVAAAAAAAATAATQPKQPKRRKPPKRAAENAVRVLDVLRSFIPLSTVLTSDADSEEVTIRQASLIRGFLELARENVDDDSVSKMHDSGGSEHVVAADGSLGKETTSMDADGNRTVWRTFKQRHGIVLEHRRTTSFGKEGDVYRATFSVKTSPQSVFDILSNPDQLKHFDEHFAGCSTIHKYDDSGYILHCTFGHQKNSVKDVFALQVRKQVDAGMAAEFPQHIGEKVPLGSFIVVWRSIAGFRKVGATSPQDEADNITPDINYLPARPPTSLVYLVGYLLEPIPSSTGGPTCKVTYIAQLSKDLPHLIGGFRRLRKMKLYVEQVTNLKVHDPSLDLPHKRQLFRSSTGLAASVIEGRSSRLTGSSSGYASSVGGSTAIGSSETTDDKIQNEKIKHIMTTASGVYSRTRAKVTAFASGLWNANSGDSGKQHVAELEHLLPGGNNSHIGNSGGQSLGVGNSHMDSSTVSPRHARPDLEAMVAEIVEQQIEKEDEIDGADDSPEDDSDDLSFYEGMRSQSDDELENVAELGDGDNQYEDLPPERTETMSSMSTRGPSAPSIRRMRTGKAFYIAGRRRRSSVASGSERRSSMLPAVTVSSPSPPHRAASLKIPLRSASTEEDGTPVKNQFTVGKRSLRLERRLGKRKSSESALDVFSRSLLTSILDFPPSECLKQEELSRILLNPESSHYVDVPFDAGVLVPFGDVASGLHGAELAWEFFCQGDHQITFSVSFRPRDGAISMPECFGPLQMESSESGDVRCAIVPLGTFTSPPSRPHEGSTLVASFPSGVFTFRWTNDSRKTGPQKRSFKELFYRIGLRAVRLTDLMESSIPPSMSPLGHLPLTSIRSEMTIRRKTLYKISIVYDPAMDLLLGHNGTEETHLAWYFSLAGFDLTFGIFYRPFVSDELDGRHGFASVGSAQPSRPGSPSYEDGGDDMYGPMTTDPLDMEDTHFRMEHQTSTFSSSPAAQVLHSFGAATSSQQSNSSTPTPSTPSSAHFGRRAHRHHHGSQSETQFARLGHPIVPLSKVWSRSRELAAAGHAGPGSQTVAGGVGAMGPSPVDVANPATSVIAPLATGPFVPSSALQGPGPLSPSPSSAGHPAHLPPPPVVAGGGGGGGGAASGPSTATPCAGGPALSAPVPIPAHSLSNTYTIGAATGGIGGSSPGSSGVGGGLGGHATAAGGGSGSNGAATSAVGSALAQTSSSSSTGLSMSLPISGSKLITGQHGVYTFVWDNTHSMVLSKTVRFAVGIATAPGRTQ